MQKAIFKSATMCLTSRMRRMRLLLLLVPVAFLQVGCSNADTSPSAGNVDANGQTVSSVPWNKPESWETDGQLGGLTGH